MNFGQHSKFQHKIFSLKNTSIDEVIKTCKVSRCTEIYEHSGCFSNYFKQSLLIENNWLSCVLQCLIFSIKKVYMSLFIRIQMFSYLISEYYSVRNLGYTIDVISQGPEREMFERFSLVVAFSHQAFTKNPLI